MFFCRPFGFNAMRSCWGWIYVVGSENFLKEKFVRQDFVLAVKQHRNLSNIQNRHLDSSKWQML